MIAHPSPIYIKGKKMIYNEIRVNYLVYEKHDDGLIISCDVENSLGWTEKQFCIDFKELNNMLGQAISPSTFEASDIISEHLFGSNKAICELDFNRVCGEPLLLKNYSFSKSYHWVKRTRTVKALKV